MVIPFGDTFKYPPKKRTSQWHIRRILYFVNHPQEIKNIELDNESSTFDILPVPIIIDGYHRWMAARYLYELDLFIRFIVCMPEEKMYWIT